MAEVDLKVEGASEDASIGEEKFVPVAEAIRYRKRAQAAEKELVQAQHKLGEIQMQKEQLAQQLSQTQYEQTLKEKLLAAGAADADTALLVVKDRLGRDDKADADKIIEQIRRDKPYLFEVITTTAFASTRGAKDKSSATEQHLKSAAGKAAKTAGRTELMEYMKARRNHL